MPKWRNRQTRATQTRVPLRIVGSTPTFGTTLSCNFHHLSSVRKLGKTLPPKEGFFPELVSVKGVWYAIHE